MSDRGHIAGGKLTEGCTQGLSACLYCDDQIQNEKFCSVSCKQRYEAGCAPEPELGEPREAWGPPPGWKPGDPVTANPVKVAATRTERSFDTKIVIPPPINIQRLSLTVFLWTTSCPDRGYTQGVCRTARKAWQRAMEELRNG